MGGWWRSAATPQLPENWGTAVLCPSHPGQAAETHEDAMNLAIGGVDAAVLIAYLAGVVLFGLWLGRGQRDVAGYLLGGRNLPWWAVLLSIVATETSTVTFLSVPGVAFDPQQGSLVFLQLTFGYILGRLVIVFVFLPHYFRGTLFTAYQVLDRRFGGATKQAASMMFLLTRNLADGLRLYLTAFVLRNAVGLDLSMCIVLIGIATILYTVLGGMRSVVFNDCVQFVVYMAGALLAGAVILANLPGGWGTLTEFAVSEGKFRLLDFSFDPTRPYTFWAGLIGGVFLSLGTHGTDQLMVQRYLAAGGRKQAGRALALSGPIVCGQFALFLMLGVGLACFYHLNPPDTAFGKNDEVFARFIVDELPRGVGVVGIILAAVFSAAMSTLSSSLNSSATAAVNDLYLPLSKRKPSAKHLLRVSRGLTVAFGLVQIGVGIAGQRMTQSVVDNVLAIAGFATGPILGVFFLGVLTPHVRQRGALIGLLGGLGLLTAAKFTSLLAWPWFALVGALATVAIGLVANVGDRGPRKPTQ